MRTRPLSPHLSVYRMHRYTLLSSFLNRVTGVVLSLGFVLLVVWLVAIGGAARGHAHALRLLATPAAKLGYAIVLAAFAYHLVAGIRHLVWDTGRGLERAASQRSAWLVFAASAVLVLLVAWLARLGGAFAP